jgi:hypothetical protein
VPDGGPRILRVHNKKPAGSFLVASSGVETLFVTFGLLCQTFEFPHHNRRHAALAPMIVGTMV